MKAEYLDPKQDVPATASPTATATPTTAATPTTSTALTTITTTTTNDGATIEVVRRPRGRPPGSKNKPKPPVIITPDPPMSPYILEIPSGNDVVEEASKFCRRRNLGLCVLAASGAVSNFTLRQPCTTPAANITFHGRFDILSISGTFLPPQATPCNMPNGLNLSLAGPQGQIVGGMVTGPLVAAGSVFLVVATFSDPVYHRLTGEDEERKGGVSSEGNAQSSPGVSGGDQAAPPPSGGGVQTPESSTGGVSMYSCHMPSDVMWPPPGHVHGHGHGSRHPPPHHHPPY